MGGRKVGGKFFGVEKRLKKQITLGRGGCVFGSSPKQLQRPHPPLVAAGSLQPGGPTAEICKV